MELSEISGPHESHAFYLSCTQIPQGGKQCVCDTYINERRGLLHAYLSFSAAGTWKAYQKAWKQLITDTLVVFPWGLTGPGAEEIEKHEAVFSKYHYIADELSYLSSQVHSEKGSSS